MSKKNLFKRFSLKRLALSRSKQGLVVFSSTLVIIGAVVYFAAVPALVQQNPTAPETLTQAVSAASGFDVADAVAKKQAAEQGNGTAGSQTGKDGTAGVSPASLSTFPTGSLETPKQNQNKGAAEEKPAGSNGTSGSAPETGSDSSGGGSESKPNEEQSAQDKVEEQRHATLVSYYNQLPGIYEQVADAYATFYDKHASLTPDEVDPYLNQVRNLTNVVTFSKLDALQRLAYPESSKWYDEYEMLIDLYTDLHAASSTLLYTWNYKCIGLSDYTGVLEQNSTNGVHYRIRDFLENYPKVKL